MRKGREKSLSTVTTLLRGLLLVAVLGCSSDHASRITASETNRAEERPTASTEGNGGAKPPTSFVANPFCWACHADFDGEELARTHERVGIGCERCHGESFPHRSDEANITPPELMYPKARINPTCMMCHPRHSIKHVTFHQPVLESGFSIFEDASSDEQAKKYCTDCHGQEHRMQRRTIRWNKATGELIP